MTDAQESKRDPQFKPASWLRLSLRTWLVGIAGATLVLAALRGESLDTAAAAICVMLLCAGVAWGGARLVGAADEVWSNYRRLRHWSSLTAAYRHVHLLGVTALLAIVAIVISNHISRHASAQAMVLVTAAWWLCPLLWIGLTMRQLRIQRNEHH